MVVLEEIIKKWKVVRHIGFQELLVHLNSLAHFCCRVNGSPLLKTLDIFFYGANMEKDASVLKPPTYTNKSGNHMQHLAIKILQVKHFIHFVT